MVSLWSLPLEQLQAFDCRGLLEHFSSLQKVHVNTVIKKKKTVSGAVLRLKMALR